jgi:cobyrinic acid a,c-diamide synthase
MTELRRAAIGTIQPGADPQPILWALLDVLRRQGVRVQKFLSRACFPVYRSAAAVAGLRPRCLDSWIMSPDTCRDVFLRGAESADLALVEGQFDSAIQGPNPGGRLELLCRWLDLPRVIVLDVSQIDPCQWPARPDAADALLLDRVRDAEHLARLTTELETLWGVPVLGALHAVPRLRAELDSIPRGAPLPREVSRRLGDCLARYCKPGRLLDLASRSRMPAAPHCGTDALRAPVRLTVAIAYDDAFNGYFRDTLDLLERRGASIVDFSPLRDEALPPQADLVYLGCGHPERYAAALSENHCMMAALRSHVRAGRRLYSEGGGTAYLCRQMETPDGRFRHMVGILPAVARLVRKARPIEPVEVSLADSNWFGTKGDRLRGYLNPSWFLEPLANLRSFVAEQGYRYSLVGTFQSVGSLLHLSFGANPALLDHFFFPEPSPELTPRHSASV